MVNSKRPYKYTSSFYRKKRIYQHLFRSSSVNVPESKVETTILSSIANVPESEVEKPILSSIANSTILNGCSSDINNDSAPQIISINDHQNDEASNSTISIANKHTIFKSQIRHWLGKHNISHLAIKELLQYMIEFGIEDLPKDSRTFMGTSRNIKIEKMSDGGEYWHNGLESGIEKVLIENDVKNCQQINLKFNIDGLPLFRGSKFQFWPILCLIDNIKNIKPFTVGIYYGDSKPGNSNEYFNQFVCELNKVLEDGILFNNIKITIKVLCFICDSPARSFIKGKIVLIKLKYLSFKFFD